MPKKKEMLVNVLQPEESRIAILEDGVLEELYVERKNQESYVGNIYKGRIVNIEPSIQAAFVDFGVGRNGFLHVSDVEYEYYKHVPGHSRPELDDDEDVDEAGANGQRSSKGGRPFNERSVKHKPPIQEIFKRGSEVLVQVIKDGVGTKGPTLSTYISIPGRYLVLMPALQRVGVSRKIPDESLRRDLRKVMQKLGPPPGIGFIVRTAGVDRSPKELYRDMNYLVRLWKVIVARVKKMPGPIDIYEESDMIIRTIRDVFDTEIETVWIDRQPEFERAQEFMKAVLPKHVDKLKLYEGKEPLFQKFGIETEIAKIHQRTVPLKGGGSIVIDQTEALVAIDVNSGTFRGDNNAEENAFRMNLRAVDEITRQLRLRDLGGVIVNDFIDMREERHRRGVEKAMRIALGRDRARIKVLRISPFGLIEMTRQRIRPSVRRSTYEDCPCCKGVGQVKSAESVAIEVMRNLTAAAHQPQVKRLQIEVHQRVGNYLANLKRRDITALEEQSETTVSILSRNDVTFEHVDIRLWNGEGQEVRL